MAWVLIIQEPETIGPDRLANAVAVRKHFGAPAVVVDFGTAVTFDVVDRVGNYIGGIITPGLAAMTDYLHEKTALLPRIKIREIRGAVGKSTEQAMLIGTVHGYRGLVRELIAELKRELKAKNLPVMATGGCAELIAAKLPEITAVRAEPDARRVATYLASKSPKSHVQCLKSFHYPKAVTLDFELWALDYNGSFRDCPFA